MPLARASRPKRLSEVGLPYDLPTRMNPLRPQLYYSDNWDKCGVIAAASLSTYLSKANASARQKMATPQDGQFDGERVLMLRHMGDVATDAS